MIFNETMSYNKITQKQKNHIDRLSHELSEAEFDAVLEATSFVEREVVSKDTVPSKKSRREKISNMTTTHASELINILKNTELREQYIFFADKLKTV